MNKTNSYLSQNEKQAGPSLNVLIVEDSSPEALKLRLTLESHDCRVEWADTGSRGFAMARQQPFDLIVLDIELPDTTGFEVCKSLKKDPNLAKIPVIMLTSFDQAENIMKGFKVGAVDYIPKDAFAETVLVETIKQMQQ